MAVPWLRNSRCANEWNVTTSTWRRAANAPRCVRTSAGQVRARPFGERQREDLPGLADLAGADHLGRVPGQAFCFAAARHGEQQHLARREAMLVRVVGFPGG
jgi:hypothetical protein